MRFADMFREYWILHDRNRLETKYSVYIQEVYHVKHFLNTISALISANHYLFNS
jgi:hypothetical protein